MLKVYIISLLIVLTLVFAPVLFLALRHEDRYAGKTVLYNSYSAKVRTIDPATCGDTTSAAMQGQVYESLYTYHYLKRPVELIPELAAAMPEVTADELVYTIRLKPDIRYARNPCFGQESDGRPKTREVRAEDFVLAIKRAADFHLQTSLAWSFLSDRIVGLDAYREQTSTYREGDFSRYDLEVDGVRALDALTLQITLVAPYPQLVYVLAMNTYAPIPRELVDYHLMTEPDGSGRRREIPMTRRTPQITGPEQMVGTGPYRLTIWDRGSRMVFERNPEYNHGFYPLEGEEGDAEAGLLENAGTPLPFIDVLYYECILEDLPSWLRFLSRQEDVGSIPPDAFSMVINPERALLDKWQEQGIRLVKFDYPAVFWLAFNMDDAVVGSSRALRQAMCLAFNVEDYIEVLSNGRGQRAVNILPRSFPTHEPAGPGPYYRYDPQAAQARLEQARQELAAAGHLEADGRIPEITIDIGGRDELFRRMGEFIQQQFEPIGIRVKIVLNDWPTLQQKVHNKQCQLYTMGWHADLPDAENFLQLFYGPNIEKGTNNTNYHNPDFDAAYDRIRSMRDSPEREKVYVDMIHMLNEDCPILLLSEPLVYLLVYDWVHNYKRHPFAYGTTKYLRLDLERRRMQGGR
ncbi:MAG: hypothetical protein GXY44_04700 [Phycisphaerales bacterium]|nr:hypothetical protein [Phycisphaerales bacterium]